MKFLVQFQLKPGTRNSAIDAFERRGPNRNPGVSLLGAWVGANEDMVFALVKSDDEAHVQSAAKSWGDFDNVRITKVIDIDQY